MDIESAANILGIPPSAPLKEIKTAYRDLVQVWHPDRFGYNPQLREKAQDKLKAINSAYSFLVSCLEGAGQSQQKPSPPPDTNSTPRNDPAPPNNHYGQSEPQLIESLRSILEKLITFEVTLARMRKDLDELADKIARFDGDLSAKIKRSLVESNEVGARDGALAVQKVFRKHVSQCRVCGTTFFTRAMSTLCQECWRAKLGRN
jgi:curved DNA-binding protein CbpA